MKNLISKIYDYSLEEIMGERFGKYSKYIIQDRAIPDVRDGLKPVQRRILFSMYKEKNTYDKAYKKSARAVGDVMGKYHPHGDSSIYDAIVRMSQDWKMREPFVDMQGNNGSIDGDSAAASRYTEARLSKISNEMLKDIDKNTVIMAPNYDDTLLEPTVLPSKFPNLLVNGTTGISAGYATNIPPHNLCEVIDATIFRIDNPNSRLETIMNYVKGPDFPTGGIACGIDGIKSAYESGRGKIIIRSKVRQEKNKIIISEIPYEVNKSLLVKKMEEIRIDKKIDGIVEVRDESDKDGLRICIDLKKDCNKDIVLNYLLKNTDLQISYNFNMIAIVNRRPKQLGILEILDAYIVHQKEVILRRTRFDLEHAKTRLHIVEGLIKCISILDEVIRVIRASKNKADARDNLVKEFDFTVAQAEAIITLQLYRLTNTDVTQLEEELKNLHILVEGLQKILDNEEVLKSVMKDELRKIKKEYATPRKTDIEAEISEIKIDTTEMIAKEDVIVCVTRDGYVKRTSLRSYQSSNPEDITLKEGDYVLGLYELNTLDTVLMFTNLGNYLYVPVHNLPVCVWKDLGKHISNIIKLDSDEKIVSVIPVTNFESEMDIVIATRNGLIKRTNLKEFKSVRFSKPLTAIKLKDKDKVVDAFIAVHNEIFIATNKSYGLWFDINDIPVVGIRTSGVKSINLKDDYVVSVSNFNANDTEYITIITDKGTAKRVKLSEFEKTTRAKRGLLLLREVKTNPYRIVKTLTIPSREFIGIKTNDIKLIKLTEIAIMDRYSTGSVISKHKIEEVFISMELTKKSDIITTNEIEEKEVKKKISLKEIDDRLMTIEDFIKIDE